MRTIQPVVRVRCKKSVSNFVNLVSNPDAYWTWANPAIAAGKKIIREREISIVFTTPRLFLRSCGTSAAERWSTWVADFRDPLAYTQKSSNDARVNQQSTEQGRRSLNLANADDYAGLQFQSIYRDMFGNGMSNRSSFLRVLTKYVHKPAAQRRPQPYFIFAGESSLNMTRYFSKHSLCGPATSGRKDSIKLLIVGTLELNRPRLIPFIIGFGSMGRSSSRPSHNVKSTNCYRGHVLAL